MSPTVFIAKDETTFLTNAVRIILEAAINSVRERGRFVMALSGGNTPKKVFGLLADDYCKSRMPWMNVFFFWADERCVPPHHPDSNFGMAQKILLSKVPLPSANAIRMPGEMTPPREAAKAYENSLRTFFRIDKSLPVFDLILLGMGEDGHTASLFPNTTALNEKEHWVVANHVEKLSADRLTLTFPVINNARELLFLCQGESKASIVKEVFRDDISDSRYPVQRVHPRSGTMRWLLDGEAASKLPSDFRYNAAHI